MLLFFLFFLAHLQNFLELREEIFSSSTHLAAPSGALDSLENQEFDNSLKAKFVR